MSLYRKQLITLAGAYRAVHVLRALPELSWSNMELTAFWAITFNLFGCPWGREDRRLLEDYFERQYFV